MTITPLSIAKSQLGIHEVAGPGADPFILWCLQLCDRSATSDEIMWCSAFATGIATLGGLPRSRSLRARSWLKVGTAVELTKAAAERTGFDVVVFKRGPDPQPGPEVEDAPGHVAFFEGLSVDGQRVFVVGGNQSDGVTQTWFPAKDVLSVRRLG